MSLSLILIVFEKINKNLLNKCLLFEVLIKFSKKVEDNKRERLC